jgi:hypothetical protein
MKIALLTLLSICSCSLKREKRGAAVGETGGARLRKETVSERTQQEPPYAVFNYRFVTTSYYLGLHNFVREEPLSDAVQEASRECPLSDLDRNAPDVLGPR